MGRYLLRRALESLIAVWRRYNVTSTIAFNHLVHKFFPPVRGVSNGIGMTITYPAGNIINPDRNGE